MVEEGEDDAVEATAHARHIGRFRAAVDGLKGARIPPVVDRDCVLDDVGQNLIGKGENGHAVFYALAIAGLLLGNAEVVYHELRVGGRPGMGLGRRHDC